VRGKRHGGKKRKSVKIQIIRDHRRKRTSQRKNIKRKQVESKKSTQQLEKRDGELER